MTNIVSRASVLAVVPQDEQGVPKAPTLATQYLTLRQGDGSIVPNFNVLESQNVRNSIGAAKPLLGLENPTYSGGHELRHSGTEGEAPDFSEILKTAFGSETVESVEYDTVGGSTTTVLKVDTGEGANIPVGSARLVKDPVNGYSIRPVHSVNGDDVTLAFPLANAPASGVNLGKAITYAPADTDHQNLTFWHYLGNGGAVAMMVDSKIVDLSLAFNAGEIITMDFTAEGGSYFFNPIEITASTRFIDWEDDDGDHTAAVAEGWYKDPHALASALQDAMAAADTSETPEVTYSDTTGKFTIKMTGSVLTLKFNTGPNAANSIASKIGFSAAADKSGTVATTGYTSDNAINLAAPQSPQYDSADGLVAKNNEVLLGDGDDTAVFSASSVTMQMATPKRDILDVNAESGKSGSIIQSRTVNFTITGLLKKYQADAFNRFALGTQTRFAYIFGEKVGGNWVAGKCGCVYSPTCTITSFEITDDDGLVGISIGLQAYVNEAGDGEIYMSFC